MPMGDIPTWVTFPEDDWTEITPAEAGLDVGRFNAYIQGLEVRGADFGGEDHTGNKWGAVITRGGRLLHVWGDRDYRFQTASTGKALVWAILGLAVEDGLVDPDGPIRKTWTGEGELSHPHKHLDHGHHRTLTWRHMIGPKNESLHYGGFPIELGVRWRERRSGLQEEDAVPGVPEWATWTGDPFYDTYSHVEPGTVGHYSSAGFWRLGQALTALWDRDLKDVVDERLFSRIGIPAERWDWPAGSAIRDSKYLYPDIPDSYTYLDPPYRINGHVVRGGPGWVVISASDLARFGHLLATQGFWKGEQLVGHQWLRGHSGGNKSGVSGERGHYTAMGVVATQGIEHPHATVQNSFLPDELFVGPVHV
jgi:CubicO group peptidase (beta-lactamase class C family)